MNYKNDPLIKKSLKNKKYLFRDILNLYSCLVRAKDFHPKKKVLNKIAYVGGTNLSKEIRTILNKLPKKLKEGNFLELRELFLRYHEIELNYHSIWRTERLLKKWFKKKLFPITFLRIISFNKEKKLVNLLKKIEFVTSFSDSVRVSLPKYFHELKKEELGYLIGVIYGDGCLLETKKDYRILIADGSSKQKELKSSLEYIEKLKSLFNKIFKINQDKIKIEKRGNWYVVFISSKWLLRFINYFFDFPIGKKKGRLKFPRILKSFNIEYQAIFWRGMFDTDGMINPSARNVEIASSDYLLMKGCKNFLSKLNIESEIKKGIDRKKGHEYYWINLKSNYFKKFGLRIGSSHPRKQKVLINHLKTSLKYYVLQGINKKYITEKGEFKLNSLETNDLKIPLPKKPTKNLIKLAYKIIPKDFEKKRVFFRTKHTKDKNLKISLDEFEKIFKRKPKFLKSRNLYYINSKLLYEFFNKFFVYKQPWEPISENLSKNLLKKWNNIFE